MSTISSLGVGSGIDIRGIVDDLVKAERAPEQQRLDSQEKQTEARLSAVGKVDSALGEFRSVLQSTQGGFDTIQASSSGSGVSISAGEDAQPGEAEIDVQQLARTQSLAVGPNGVTGDEDLGGGSLTFRFGDVTTDGSGNVTDFQASDSRGTVTLDIDPAESSLNEIRDAVNEADFGVRASVVNDGDQDRLVLNDSQTGADNGFVVDVASDTNGSAIEDLAFNQASSPNAQLNRAAQDAAFTIDGLAVTRSSNTVDDILEGSTVTLESVTDDPVTVSVEEDSSGVVSGVEKFVEGFNALQGQLNKLTAFDPETGESGPLNGDPLVRNLTSQLRSELTRPLEELEGRSVRALSDIGILTNRDGTLELDREQLEEGVSQDPQAVEALFSQTGIVEGDGFSLRNATSSAEAGRYDVEVTAPATQGQLTTGDLGTFPQTLADGDNTFSVSVDGVDTDTLSLEAREYTSASDVAGELARTINGASAVRDNDLNVDVDVQNDGSLQILSNNYGSDSSFSFNSSDAGVDDLLALSGATSTDGTDVQGTIGGTEATGEGLQLTAFEGPADGISVDTNPGASGQLGTLVFSQGALAGADTVLNRFLTTGGIIDSQTDSLNNRLEQVEEGRTELNERMEQVEKRLTDKFGNMDALVAELQQTGNFLQQQLGGGGGGGLGGLGNLG